MRGDPIKLNNLKFIGKAGSVESSWEIWISGKRINSSGAHAEVSLNGECNRTLSGKYVFDTARYWWGGFIAARIELYKAVSYMSGGTGIYHSMKVAPCMQQHLTPFDKRLKIRWS